MSGLCFLHGRSFAATPDNEAKGIDQSQIIRKLRQDIATVSVGRLKIMVIDELETIESAYAPADVEAAKRAVLLSARVQVKKQGVSLESLTA